MPTRNTRAGGCVVNGGAGSVASLEWSNVSRRSFTTPYRPTLLRDCGGLRIDLEGCRSRRSPRAQASLSLLLWQYAVKAKRPTGWSGVEL